jgi:PKD repeat protein
VGLLFAGSDSYTIANPIDLVLDRFDVTVDDGSGGTVDPPVADFSATPVDGDAPLTVDFTDLSTENPTSWSWSFGDGGTSTAQNPSYTYYTPGTYTVTMTVANSAGSDTATKTGYISITEPTPVPPVADFSATPTGGYVPLAVDFTDLSTGSPTSWLWDFGDGTGTSTEQNPSYTYSTAGTYTVTLTASNADGSDGETKVDYITVEPQTGLQTMTVDYTEVVILGVRRAGRNYFVRARAEVHVHKVENGVPTDPVAGATVQGVWSNAINAAAGAVTNAEGIAYLDTEEVKIRSGSLTFDFSVTDVTASGYVWDELDDLTGSASWSVP